MLVDVPEIVKSPLTPKEKKKNHIPNLKVKDNWILSVKENF